MKLTVDLPEDVFDKIMTLAVREHRHTAQQASYLLTRLMRDGQHAHEEDKRDLQDGEGKD